jgi:FkbM family methyltransferase
MLHFILAVATLVIDAASAFDGGSHYRHVQSALAPFAFPQLYRCTNTDLKQNNESKSQAREDFWLYEQIFSKLPKDQQFGGTFVEIGALDGLQFSNTYFFEKKLDWRGVLIEGHPVNQAKLLVNVARERSNSVAFPAAICPLHGNRAGTVRFTARDGAVGADADAANEKFLAFWHGQQKGLLSSDCVPMQAILEMTNVVDIDLFSLDVEGSELNVLKTINFHVTNVHVLVVELDGGDKDKDQTVRDFLKAQGFQPALDSVGNIRDRCPNPNYGCTSNEVFINPQYVARKRPRQLYQHGTSMKCATDA